MVVIFKSGSPGPIHRVSKTSGDDYGFVPWQQGHMTRPDRDTKRSMNKQSHVTQSVMETNDSPWQRGQMVEPNNITLTSRFQQGHMTRDATCSVLSPWQQPPEQNSREKRKCLHDNTVTYENVSSETSMERVSKSLIIINIS